MTADALKVLIYGYGNPGRLDDGLGPAFADAFETMHLKGVTVDSNYQLSIEDAAAVQEHNVVIFADADTAGAGPFFFKRIEPKAEISFSTHSVKPEALLALAQEYLGSAPVEGYLLGIRGYEFNEFGEKISDMAKQNLQAAVEFVQKVLQEQNFSERAKLYESVSVRGESVDG